jgi:hypothetical protein
VSVDAELADIIRGGASLLPRMWRAIERCRTDPAPKGDLARECGNLVRAYTELSERARQLPSTELVQRVDRMLTCQLHTAAQASSLAFRVHDSRWPALAARFGDGQGPVSDELLYLAAEVSRVRAPCVQETGR